MADHDPHRADADASDTGPLADRRVEELDAELAAAREEARQAHDRWLRERADLENLKKRSTRERQETVRYGIESLARDLLPVVDNLERALAAARSAGEAGSLVQGVELVRKAFLDVLQRHGVEQVSAVGEGFDPTRHEAVAHVASDVHEANQVIEEHQAGYRLHDRLLRPAMVTVSKGKNDAQ
jgi:molecular chaperone GrpE